MFNGGQHSFRRPAQNGQSNQAKRQRAQTQHVNPAHLNGHMMMQSFFGFPDMNHFGFGAPGGHGGFSSFSAFSTSGNGGRSGGVVKSTSKSTKVVNGKKYITTK